MNGYRLLMLLLGLGMGLFSQSVLADPPGRVGRISYLSGQVEFSASPYDLSNPAHINWPVTLDNIIQTQRFGRAEVRIGSTALRLDDETEIRFEQLDDQFVRVRMERGNVYVNLRNAENAREFELSTPQGRLTLFGPATFRIDFSTRPDSTTIHLFSGRGQFDNKGVIWPLETGKQFSLLHDESITQNLYMNEFDRWSMARDRAEEKSTSTRYVSAETTGYEELDRHGVWRESEEYGSVWYPRSVPEGWAPYRHGRWTWLQPWGWTWVDDAPWGYAPSHYGRWVWLGGRWCWSPGRRATRPVWAPAVVGWVVQQKSGNTVVSGNPNIGWFPLSPGTTYKPVYAVSSNYLDQLNSGHTHRRHGPEVTYPHHTGITTIDSSHFNSNKIVIVKQGVIQMVDSKTAPNQLRQYDNGRSGQPLAPPAPVGHELRPAGQVHTAPSQGNLPNGAVTVLPRRNTVVEPPRPIHRPSSPVAPAVQPIPQPVQPRSTFVEQPPIPQPVQPRSTFVEQPPIPQPVQPRSTFVEQPSTAQPLQPRPPVVQQPPIGQPIPQPIAQPRQPRPTFVEQPPIAQPVQPRPVVVHQPPVAQPYQPRPAVVEQPIPQPIQPRQPVVQPPPVIHTPPQAPPQPRPTVAQPAPAQAVPVVPRPIEPRPASAKADEGVPRGNIRHPGKERDEKLDKMK